MDTGVHLVRDHVHLTLLSTCWSRRENGSFAILLLVYMIQSLFQVDDLITEDLITDENIPETLAEGSAALIDSDDEVMNTKYEMSKME